MVLRMPRYCRAFRSSSNVTVEDEPDDDYSISIPTSAAGPSWFRLRWDEVYRFFTKMYIIAFN